METKRLRIGGVVVAVLVLMGTGFFSGCTNDDGNGGPQVISVSGSTTVLPIIAVAAEDYMDAHANTDIRVQGGGSGTGVSAVGQGKRQTHP